MTQGRIVISRIPLKGGDEQDALSPWRKYLRFGAGERKKSKRKYNKRFRKSWRLEIEKNGYEK